MYFVAFTMLIGSIIALTFIRHILGEVSMLKRVVEEVSMSFFVIMQVHRICSVLWYLVIAYFSMVHIEGHVGIHNWLIQMVCFFVSYYYSTHAFT